MKHIQLFEQFEKSDVTNFSEVFSKCNSISTVSLDKKIHGAGTKWMFDYAKSHKKVEIIEYKKNLCIGFDEWMREKSAYEIQRYDWNDGKWSDKIWSNL